MRKIISLYLLCTFLFLAIAEAQTTTAESITSDGMPVQFSGDWSQPQADRVAKLLKELDGQRKTIAPGIFSRGYKRYWVVEPASNFEYLEVQHDIDNPAALYGGGISGRIFYVFRVPLHVSDEELKGLIGSHLPEIYEKDHISKWRRTIRDCTSHLLPKILGR